MSIFCYDLNHMPISSSVAVYKALYKSFGGFAADVVAAIDQVPVICWVFLQTITYQTAGESSVAFLNQNGKLFCLYVSFASL